MNDINEIIEFPNDIDYSELSKRITETKRLFEEAERMERPRVAEIRNFDLADWKYEKIKEQIEEFQSDLNDDIDVCVSLASFGKSMIMQVDDIGYQNPDLLYFYGYINGNKAQLIQHASQLNFALIAVKKEDTTRPPRRIGFVSD